MKRAIVLSVLVGMLLLPAPARANHELPHVDPIGLVQTVVETFREQTVNRTPQGVFGYLHVDHAAGRWRIDCTHPFSGTTGAFCPMIAEGDHSGDDHIGPVDAPSCTIPAGSGGTGRWAPPLTGYHPADLLDLEFAPAPAESVSPPVRTPALVVMHGSWRDDFGRADRFVATLSLSPLACGEISHYGVVFGQGWALGLR